MAALRSAADIKDLRRRATEVAAAWEQREGQNSANPMAWSEALRPAGLAQWTPWNRGSDHPQYVSGMAALRGRHGASAVEMVIRKRSSITPDQGEGARLSGRVLLYDRNLNLGDGAANAESAGLFDVDNVPSWDLWIGYSYSDDAASLPVPFTGDCLLCWIPDALLPVVEHTLAIHVEGALAWSDEAGPLASRVRAVGLTG